VEEHVSREWKKEKHPGETTDAVDAEAPSEDIKESMETENAETSSGQTDPSGEEEKGLDQQLADALEEAADLRDKMLRLAADYENFKKRIERERAVTMKYAGEYIFREFLPVVDNLERAISLGVVNGADAEKNLAALLEGVELTLKSLLTSLEKFEVKAIDSVGEKFDPNKHEALTMEPSDTVAVNHVTNEFEKGYFYKDRLLRAAKVIVSSGKAVS
jgi:molecular chaperone GrpE